jgi:hypothetical protein
MVGVEVSIFPREEGVDEVLGHLVDRDRLPVLLAEKLRDFPVVDIQDPGGKGYLRTPELLLGGDIPSGGKGDPEGDSEKNGDCKGYDQQDLERGALAGKRTH